MDIRVGAPSAIGPTSPKTAEAAEPIEARLLAVRPARRRAEPVAQNSRDRRRQSTKRDPRGGRVLILMVPDGQRLPPGLDQGAYRIFLRIARR